MYICIYIYIYLYSNLTPGRQDCAAVVGVCGLATWRWDVGMGPVWVAQAASGEVSIRGPGG
jgi:hypothetical protein